ncbi:MAG: thioredoxin family protein [Candidatus Eisenbacteria bacterium]
MGGRRAGLFVSGLRDSAWSLLSLVALLAFSPSATRAEGVTWRDLTFEEAMAESKTTGLPVFVDVWAEHCGQCGTMEEEFWPTEDAARLTDGTIPIQIRSDDPKESLFRQRYPILGLPAIILIDPDGTEIDRVSGYYNASRFVAEASSLFDQMDPLPELEASFSASPDDLPTAYRLLETYANRARTADAERMLVRVLELDPENEHKYAEKAFLAVAKYHDYFTRETDRSQELWRQFVEELPDASSVAQGLKATFEYAKAAGTLEEWKTWVCGVLAEHPDSGRFAYSVAIWGNRGQLRGQCLADAARTAHRLEIGPAWMDSLADVFEGN